ncbi:FAD-binding protein [Phenylobacterium sp.]|uniref:FAD-binding protein n=1 Tax=Phenylobacterium sp. TaxID=1871053 RepID=UPI0028965EDA|nr:FAD-binding protein [Phenylobacterium sp.]
MGETWKPRDGADAAAAVGEALAQARSLELLGTGTRRAFGRPVEADVALDLSALNGVVTYQPEELILAVEPAAPMAQVAAMLAERGQCLAFEPPDFGPLWGLPAGLGTVGGAIMTGRGGPRRLTAGGPRDHCLGIKGVNGFGQAFAAGGRVVKNVTGFDVCKLATGSFGTLCAVTELTLKVLPAPPQAQTLVIGGLTDEAAMAVMSRALGCPAQVSSAAHLPADVAARSHVGELSAANGAVTLLRVEGVGPSVTARIAHLAEVLSSERRQAVLDREASALAWKEIADAAPFAGGEGQVWKLSVAPSLGAAVGRRLADELGGRCFYDWGGGAVWLELPAAPDAHAGRVRDVLAQVAGGDGHATLMRADARVRAQVAPFQPLAPGVGALTERVRAQFDPQRIFNPGRMYA